MTDSAIRTFPVRSAGVRHRVRRIDPPGASAERDRPTLVFLHEGLGNIEHWRGFPEALCRRSGLPGVVYDRRGYGGSDPLEGPWPVDYLMEESTVHLPAVLDGCGAGEAVPVGHSDGGTIALIAAATLGPRIRGAVTEAAHIFVEPVTLAGIRRAVDAFETGALKEKLRKYHGNRTESVFRRWSDTWLSPGFRDWNIESLLPRITCPVLAVQGTSDEYGSAAQVEGIGAGVSGPVKTAMIPDRGHSPHVEAAEIVLDLIDGFLRGL